MNSKFIIFCMFLTLSLAAPGYAQINEGKGNSNSYFDPIKDLPEIINSKYVIPMIPDEETALQYAEIIFKKRYKGMDFEEVKPFEVYLIAEEKVWDIKAPVDKRLKGIAYFHLRINKNTGEILNSWVDK